MDIPSGWIGSRCRVRRGLYRTGYAGPGLERERAGASGYLAHDHGVHGQGLAVEARGDGLGGHELVALGAPAGEQLVEYGTERHAFEFSMERVDVAVFRRGAL